MFYVDVDAGALVPLLTSSDLKSFPNLPYFSLLRVSLCVDFSFRSNFSFFFWAFLASIFCFFLISDLFSLHSLVSKVFFFACDLEYQVIYIWRRRLPVKVSASELTSDLFAILCSTEIKLPVLRLGIGEYGFREQSTIWKQWATRLETLISPEVSALWD